MDGSGRSDEKESIKVGDIEKEKEIERRLRELGLWENKRLLESRVASMLDAHIEEQDALSRTLRKCRRRRAGDDGGGGGGKTAIEEIRNIISPRIIRDCYGQRLAYQVNILMGCFTKNIEHEVIDDVIIIRGSTSAVDDDPKRLTKELRLELPPSLNMAALQLNYAAGAVKIRVPYLIELPPSLKRPSSESTDARPNRLTSISPIYSLNMALSRTKLGSSGADSLCSESPNSANSLTLSPLVPTTSDSLGDSIDLQPRSPVPQSPATTLPSPFPVFEDDTSRIASGNANWKENDLGRRTNESTLEGSVVLDSTTIPEEGRSNGFTVGSERVSGVRSRAAESGRGRGTPEESVHKSTPQEETLHSTENIVFKRNSSTGQHGQTLNGSVGLRDSNNLVKAIPNGAQATSDETVASKSIDRRLGNNLRKRVSPNTAAIYVDIPDSMDINSADDLIDAVAIRKGLRDPTQLTSGEELTSKYASDDSRWSSSSDHTKPDPRGSKDGNRRQDEGAISVHVVNDEMDLTHGAQKRKAIGEYAEDRNQESVDNEGVQTVRSNTLNRRSTTMSAERMLGPSTELDTNIVNERREVTNRRSTDDTEVTKNSNHYDELSSTDLYGKRNSETKYMRGPTNDKASQDDHAEQISIAHSEDEETANMSKGITKKGFHNNAYSSVRPCDENGVTAQKEVEFEEESVEKNSLKEGTIENDQEGLSSMASYRDRKVTSGVNTCISDKKVSMISINGGDKTGPLKQTSQKDTGLPSVTEDSYRVGASSKSKRSPTPKKPNNILDYLLDSLDETFL